MILSLPLPISANAVISVTCYVLCTCSYIWILSACHGKCERLVGGNDWNRVYLGHKSPYLCSFDNLVTPNASTTWEGSRDTYIVRTEGFDCIHRDTHEHMNVIDHLNWRDAETDPVGRVVLRRRFVRIDDHGGSYYKLLQCRFEIVYACPKD